MTKLTDKIIGWTMSTVGIAGLVSGIGLITDDPKRLLGIVEQLLLLDVYIMGLII